VLAPLLAAALALTSAGTPRAKADAASPENAARARRGLLPRKTARLRSPARLRHIVVLPPAPTWLGEPGLLAPEEPVAEIRIEPVSDPLDPPAGAPEARGPAGARWAALAGAEVEAILTRRGDAPLLRAAFEEPEVEVFVRRRPVAR
jgi:hypothetical protein